MKNKITLPLLAILAVLTAAPRLSAQEAVADEGVVAAKGWYLGAEGGLPFGLSTFSSFGHDKTHIGWTGGLYGGYKFNPVLSLELAAKYGQMTLTARDCCADRDYWLGSDGVRYNADVADMDCWNYSDLCSRVDIGQYGVRLNVNVLGFFSRTKMSRWSVALSPHLYGVSTKASVQTLADGTERQAGSTKWHLGYGGDLQVAFQAARHLQIGIYSGVTALTGSRMDAMPEYLHKNNFVWESGLRIGITFGKNKKKPAPAVEEEPTPAPVVCPEETEEPTAAEPELPVTVAPAEETAEITFPDIYFAFNRKNFAATEEPKLQAILETLEANPDMKITVSGWCDTNGPATVNKRYSEARAQAVKKWLVDKGISADRIEIVGMGSDFNETDAAKARRASTENQKD